MSDGDLIAELYAGCFRRLVVQLYAVTGDLSEAQERAASTGATWTSVAPGYAWLFGRDDGSTGERGTS
ncbi:hypothetical protein AB0C04_30835 [Micromonospora sp. NPDC048909]|uniref:hypothetical protein n=1 Tax=Micromonospora sp. NPDC048909 TaxID=3155643 RepID=UPI0033FBE0F8